VSEAVSGIREKKTEEREMGERKWSGKWKFNILVERGAAFQPASRSALMLCAERFVSFILKVW
jgi:hypothetical protein